MARKRKQTTKKTRQRSGWINRYDFSHARGDTMNTGLKT